MYILGSEDRIPSENVSWFFYFPIRNVIDFQGLHARTVPIFMILEKRAVLTNLIRFGYTSLKIRN